MPGHPAQPAAPRQHGCHVSAAPQSALLCVRSRTCWLSSKRCCPFKLQLECLEIGRIMSSATMTFLEIRSWCSSNEHAVRTCSLPSRAQGPRCDAACSTSHDKELHMEDATRSALVLG